MYEIFERLLAEKGLMTVDVCKATGISQSTISNWKKRKNTLSPALLQKIANYFGVSLDYMMGKETNELFVDIPTKKESPALTAEEKEFLNLFETASQEAREFVISTLKRSIQVSSPRE